MTEREKSGTTASFAPDEDVRTAVREHYGAIAEGHTENCCSGGACGCSSVTFDLETLGYNDEQIAGAVEGSDLGLGCGSPLAQAEARPGETVLDLGSGAGIDCFLAARAVGREGRVIGVDMTPPMLERARAIARRQGFDNVEFRLGEIEHLPLADASVDLVISNCVVNLSPDKPQVFREALRVLRPGGRMFVSDLVLTRALPAELRRRVDLHVGCIAGALLRDDYLGAIRDAGFTEVEIVRESRYGTVGAGDQDDAWEQALGSVVSVTVRGRRAG